MTAATQSENPSTLTQRMPTERIESRRRLVIIIAMIVCLALSAIFQNLAFAYRNRAVSRGLPEAGKAQSRASNLDSFSLALLLGGLRGPLVMYLWTSSESQKSDKDLDSFDTKVELIRLLQPEFDSVLLFQMWNLGYNVSVQYSSLSNKYAAILEAIEFGERADRTSPNNINVLTTMGTLYSEKLGSSSEKDYYRRRVRTETLPVYRVTFPKAAQAAFQKAINELGLDETRTRQTPDASGNLTALVEKVPGDRLKLVFAGPGISYTPMERQLLRPKSQGARQTEMDTLLDEKGNVLGQYLKPLWSTSGGREENNGAKLQYLERFQPFPYGVSPLALGYNYAKRGQVLQTVGKQRHLQLSDMVVDNQPAMTLKQWAEEEWDRGRRLEVRALGKSTETESLPRELKTASIKPDAAVVDRAAFDEAVYSYNRAAEVADASVAEFVRHLKEYTSTLQNFNSHTDNLRAIAFLNRADAHYLEAVLATSPADKAQRLSQAKEAYIEAARWYYIQSLKYYIDDPDAAQVPYTRATVDTEFKTTQDLAALYDKTLTVLKRKYGDLSKSPHVEDRAEYEEELKRINQRLSNIK